jgi:hypothetical protein
VAPEHDAEPSAAADVGRSRPAGSRRRLAAVSWAWVFVSVAVVLAVVLSWWPSLVRSHGDSDVTLVLDTHAAPARDVVERALRGRGVSPTTEVSSGDGCAVATAAAEAAASTVLAVAVSTAGVSATGPCTPGTLVERLAALDDTGRWRSVVVLLQPMSPSGAGPVDVSVLDTVLDTVRRGVRDADGLTLADPSWLLGEAEGFPERVVCQWWERGVAFERTCEADGRVPARGPDGAWTPAGWERLARVLASAIP